MEMDITGTAPGICVALRRYRRQRVLENALCSGNHDDFLDKKASFVRSALHDGCPDMIAHSLLISPAIIYIHSRFLGTAGMVQTMCTGNFS
jgi:hypothetical protein